MGRFFCTLVSTHGSDSVAQTLVERERDLSSLLVVLDMNSIAASVITTIQAAVIFGLSRWHIFVAIRINERLM